SSRARPHHDRHPYPARIGYPGPTEPDYPAAQFGRALMTADVIDSIVKQNLGVYRESPPRLLEDVSQEAQVASDYRGRLVYELLQNADDAMAEETSIDDRVSFLVTDNELWIANSG